MSIVRNIFGMRSVDNEYSLSLNAFNGRIYMSVFKEGYNKPISIWLSNNLKILMIDYIENLLSNPQPNVSNVVFIMRYNNDTKERIKEAMINIFTDDKGHLGLIINVLSPFNNGDNQIPQELINKNIKFMFNLPINIEFESPMTDKDRNNYGAKIFLNVLKHKLHVAEVFSQQDMDYNTNSTTTNSNVVDNVPNQELF